MAGLLERYGRTDFLPEKGPEQNQFLSSFKPWVVEIYYLFTCIAATSFTEIERRISYVLDDDDFERGETN